MFASLTIAALLAGGAPNTPIPAREPVIATHIDIAVDLRPMSPEDRKLFPGRERFDKTEWYESQLKSVQTVVIPRYVEAWNNQGVDIASLANLPSSTVRG